MRPEDESYRVFDGMSEEYMIDLWRRWTAHRERTHAKERGRRLRAHARERHRVREMERRGQGA